MHECTHSSVHVPSICDEIFEYLHAARELRSWFRNVDARGLRRVSNASVRSPATAPACRSRNGNMKE
eukprot:SAG31_NODE_765_length_12248_cov_6.802947_6_plen_67_part_00